MREYNLMICLYYQLVTVQKFHIFKHQRYAHAKQFKRANRSLRKLKTYLGRVIRDIRRKTAGNEGLYPNSEILTHGAQRCAGLIAL